MAASSKIYTTLSGRLRPGMFAGGGSALAVDRPTEAPTIRLVSFEDKPLEIVAVDPSQFQYQWGGWALGYGVGGQVSRGFDLDYSAVGTLVGIERFLDCNTLLGFYGSYGATNVNNGTVAQFSDSYDYLGGL